MTAAKVNLPVIEQGATYVHNLLWRAPDKTTPINLTNVSAKMQVRTTLESPTVVIELSTDNGRLSIDGPAGKIHLEITNEDTANLVPVKDAVYDLEIYHINGTVTRLVEGKLSIKAEVTRG
jgi:hypothetical protein